MKSYVVCKHHKALMPDLSSESLWTINTTLALLGLIFSTSKIKVQNDVLKQVSSSNPSSFKILQCRATLFMLFLHILKISKDHICGLLLFSLKHHDLMEKSK